MNTNYTVLARKYRPSTINDLKGQEVLVTTLKNAFASQRIAHAFLLSGVRGVGKTTTARILAKALNCVGIDGNGQSTLNPCNQCDQCKSINNDNNLDVLEMDAASKTGIEDIREIIEAVQYKPITSRYKVYIIDEIHMLSKSAFNALLKTLEEPPAFVKFIFATTEIKKVPITIISRCQRFDLRRLTAHELQNHLANICNNEHIIFDNNSLLLIANASEGSVRDSLSILDQAINISNGNITEEIITNLLGRGNKEDMYNLFASLMHSNQAIALEIINKLYNNGVEIISIFEELLEVCHLITMIKTSVLMKNKDTNVAQELGLTAFEENSALKLAKDTPLNGLVILWQILSKGLEELKLSSFPKKTAEMIVIRILWINEVATLPSLNSLLNKNQVSLVPETFTNTASNINKEEILKNSEDTPASLDKDIKKVDNKALEELNAEKETLPNTIKEAEASLEEVFELFPTAQAIKKNN